jgi:hypothetical protein
MVIATAPDQRTRLSTAPTFRPTVGSGARPPGDLSPSGTCDARRLLDGLRSAGVARPAVDPGLSGGLRAWLDDGLATMGLDDRRGTGPVVLGTPSLPATARPAPQRADGVVREAHRVRLALVRSLFQLAVTVGLGARPFEEALAALSVDEDGIEVVEFVRQLGRGARARCREEAVRHAAVINSQWGVVAPGWFPRTAEALSAPLAGGAVILSTTADLVLGAPSSGLSSVCLVRVALDVPTPPTVADRAFLALLETLRSGAAPFRVATYRPDCARLVVDEVTDGLLASAVSATLDRLAARPEAAGSRVP